jgi:ketopantoate hydroxymethyltransferase
MADKITVLEIARMKQRGEKIAVVTAYDYPGWLPERALERYRESSS